MKPTSFRSFMLERFEAGGFTTEDLLSTLLPLMRETLEAHNAGMVAPLDGPEALYIDHYRAWFAESDRREIRANPNALRQIESARIDAFQVIGEYNADTDLDTGHRETDNLQLGEFDESLQQRVYLPGYVSWEHLLGHHDPLTDIFSLGMLLASLACRLDFQHQEDLEQFVTSRNNLFHLAPELHPVVARAIVRMTELDRHQRVQDLSAIIRTLENYRYQETDLQFELASIEGFETSDHRSKQAVILSKLKDRLFDLSKRNRLLNFRQTMQSVNLTQASVPLSFNLQTIRADQLLTCNQQLQKQIGSGKRLSLNQFLNFGEAIYLPGILDRILAEARKDAAEYGMAQLRLAICFLNWSNIKEKPIQQYESPLLLVPVRLVKKRGLVDTYSLEILETVAEVNPVLRHQFRQLYELEIPESIDLEKADVDQFFEYLKSCIENSAAGITLEKIDKPRVSIVHEKAKRRLDQYRRRARLSGRGMRTFLDLDYSYDPANYHPLGVKIFANFIQPTCNHLRQIVESSPPPKRFMVSSESDPESSSDPDSENVAEVKRTFVNLNEKNTNHYRWQYDLCNVTLANFKYRKMSLVRDYDTLLETPQDNHAFDAVFSLKPQSTEKETQHRLPIESRFDVLPCDPTQASSIAQSRVGESYIIQGPPGTGKSQTIANLIADYVAQGKRVLFVCEKRAAIDVVYSRLKQQGLGALCTLIHDSQTDKKEFVMDLKATYEAFLEPSKKHSPTRATVLSKLQKSLSALDANFQKMTQGNDLAGVSLRELINRCLELKPHLPSLDVVQKESLASYAVWVAHRDRLEELAAMVSDFQPNGVFSEHPLSCLSSRVAVASQPVTLITETTQQATQSIDDTLAALSRCGVPQDCWQKLGDATQLVDFAVKLLPFSQSGQLPLLDPDSEWSQQFRQATDRFAEINHEWQTRQEKNKAWVQKIPQQELPAAIAQAKSFEGGYFNWLSPAWWKLRGIMKRAYDFSSHMIQPTWASVLETLELEYQAKDAQARQAAALQRDFGMAAAIPEALENELETVAKTRQWLEQQPARLRKIYRQLLDSKKQTEILKRVASASESVYESDRLLKLIFDHVESKHWGEFQSAMKRVSDAIDQLPDFMACLKRLDELPGSLTESLRELPVTLVQLEAAIANATFERELQNDRAFSQFNFAEYQSETNAVHEHYQDWLDVNAKEILFRQRQQFLESVELSEKQNSELTAEEKAFKKQYRTGRRELEHEFGKSMRYKPIRDLMAGDSGKVVNDLKPVWLMSPLSVSDTLPLQGDLVDVVIFDEASQVTLEEAIPTIFRAPQAIVVGDEMQLPPTDFFGSKSTQDDSELEFEEEGEVIQYDLNTNSLLSHTARNLSSTMLGWHYRSRSESLISFSNHAFYQGRLLTVPEEGLADDSMRPIRIDNVASSKDVHLSVLERPLSFHHLPLATYDNRRNRDEADYVARLVRDLLRTNANSDVQHSIGVVAFSEAQQDEIEQALKRLGQEDANFRTMFEAELEREEDNQFVGLLVKNLENIQGDERDIIILSVCYGQNPQGKMYMNFGPINKIGGEKRLNVAFSRAKKHMCIVSSITGNAITNDYNDGARCLKEYLNYAEACSAGSIEHASAVLHRLAASQHDTSEAKPLVASPILHQISDRLRQEGWKVDHHIGQSSFRCQIGIRKPGDKKYRLGVLVDNDDYYRLDDAIERDVMRPRLLEAFGWNIVTVLSKDWYLEPEGVIDRIQGQLDHPTTDR